MATVINTKLGEHRGKKRVWIEGKKLSREGYESGMKYDVEFKNNQVKIQINKSGRYTVSKRTRNGLTQPIIELKADQLAEIFDGVEMLRVAIRQGRIIITAHHQESLVKERVERLVNKMQTGEPLSVCSLFHGGGVIDSALHKGLEDAGLNSRISVAVELEGKYLESSLENNEELWDDDSMVIESPIQSVNLGKNAPQCDVLISGIPCVGASKSGRTKNKLKFAESHSSAGAMFFSFLRFCETLNPSIIIIENVPEYANTASWEVICSVLGTLGYTMQARILNGNEFGALENRDRLCAVAISRGINGFDLDSVQPVREKPSKLSDVLENIPLDSDRWKNFEYLAEKEKRDKAAGKGFSRQLLTGDEPFCGTIGKGYAKCRSTEPFIIHPLNPSLSRILLPTEHASVKGIPHHVINFLSDTTAHEILGQSVIYPVFEAVAHSLGESLWQWQGYTTAKVEMVDDNQPSIGGEDFQWAPAVIDDQGRLKLTPAAERSGLSLNMLEPEGSEQFRIVIRDPAGTTVSSNRDACNLVPVSVIEKGVMQIPADAQIH